MSIISFTHAQLSQFVPPSPEAASLSRFVEYPVSHYAGLPQINLPLYELQVNDVVIPISLSYHGGGIQATEEATRVGLGWTLIAGGAVVRSLRGLPDEAGSGTLDTSTPSIGNIYSSIYGYRGYEKLTPKDKFVLNHLKEKKNNPRPDLILNTEEAKLNQYMISALYNTYEWGLMDVTPDVYTFNFLGNSGTFLRDDNSLTVMQTESMVKLKNRTSKGFEFTDQNGNIYYFEDQEETWHPWTHGSTNSSSLPEDTIKYISAWYLSRIETPQNDRIEFIYSDMPDIRTYNGRSEQYALPAEMCVPGTFSGGDSFSKIFPKRLDEIRTKDLKVQFISNETPRQDIYNDRSQLDYLIVKNQNDEVIKQIGFEYSYFESRMPVNTLEKYKPLYYRLKLDALREYSLIGNESLPYYSFTYAGDGSLPHRSTAQKDYWGYFNDNMGSVLPRVKEMPNWLCAPDYGHREPHFESMVKGTLTSIKYPTGGETQFIWEGHEYSYIKDSKINNNMHLPKPEMEYKSVQLCGLKDKETLSIDVKIDVKQTIKLYTRHYYGSTGTNRPALQEWMSSIYFPGYYQNSVEGSNIPTLEIYYLETPNSTPQRKDIIFLDQAHYNRPGKDHYYSFRVEEKGIYRFKLLNARVGIYNDDTGYGLLRMFEDRGFYGTNPAYGIIPIEYGYYPSNSDVEEEDLIAIAGGLRIKEITSLSENQTTVRRYIYRNPTNLNLSSGILVELPRCYYLYHDVFYGYLFCEPRVEINMILDVYTVTSEGSYHTIPSKQHIEYETITEVVRSISELDIPTLLQGEHTIYHYTTVKSDSAYVDIPEGESKNFDVYQSPSSRMRTSKSHWRGNLQKVEYKYGDKKVKEIEYQYAIYEDQNKHFFNGDFYVLANYGNLSTNQEYQGNRFAVRKDYGLVQFRVIPYNKLLKSQTEKTYPLDVSHNATSLITEYGTGNWFEEKVEYTYSYDQYKDNYLTTNLVHTEKRTLSDSKQEIIYYFYHPVVHKLHATVKVVDGYIVEAKRYEYDTTRWVLMNTYTADIISDRSIAASSYLLHIPILLPDGLETLINVPEYTYNYQLVNGVPKVRRVNYKGISTHYIWGYQGSYPIAEIRLPEGDRVFLDWTSFSGVNMETLTNHTGTSDILQAIRTRNPKSEITTYSYYWGRGIYSRTNERGVTTYYHYDDFGRLKSIKDFNGYVIEEYEYHYQNQ